MALLQSDQASQERPAAWHRSGLAERLVAAALLPVVIVLMLVRPGWFERDEG